MNPGLPSAEGGTDAKGGTKKATYRDRIASGRRAATATATATATTTTATTEQPAAAPLGTPRHPSSEPDDGPVPSETPAKLRRREGGEGDDTPSRSTTLEPTERVLTKAEEAKNRLRRNRRSSQSAVGAAGGFTARVFGRRRRLGVGGLGGFRFGPLAPYVGVGEARAESRSLRGGTRG